MLFRFAKSNHVGLATVAVGLLSTVCIAAWPAVATATETVVVTGKKRPVDPCVAVAAAKYAQWGQERMMIDETRTFADGTKRNDKVIYTANAAYGQHDGRPWNTVQLTRPQRTAYSPETVEKSMSLGTCEFVGTEDEDGGRSASLYAITYLPDKDGSRSSGKIWIIDATGLPLRQEMQNPTQPNARVAVEISAHYSYGDDVKVPRSAEVAEFERRERTQLWLYQLQLHQSPALGP